MYSITAIQNCKSKSEYKSLVTFISQYCLLTVLVEKSWENMNSGVVFDIRIFKTGGKFGAKRMAFTLEIKRC